MTSSEDFIFLGGNLGEIGRLLLVTVRFCNRDDFGTVYYQNSASHHNPELDWDVLLLFSVLEVGGWGSWLRLSKFDFWMDEHSRPLPGEVSATEQFHSTVFSLKIKGNLYWGGKRSTWRATSPVLLLCTSLIHQNSFGDLFLRSCHIRN